MQYQVTLRDGTTKECESELTLEQAAEALTTLGDAGKAKGDFPSSLARQFHEGKPLSAVQEAWVFILLDEAERTASPTPLGEDFQQMWGVYSSLRAEVETAGGAAPLSLKDGKPKGGVVRTHVSDGRRFREGDYYGYIEDTVFYPRAETPDWVARALVGVGKGSELVNITDSKPKE